MSAERRDQFPLRERFISEVNSLHNRIDAVLQAPNLQTVTFRGISGISSHILYLEEKKLLYDVTQRTERFHGVKSVTGLTLVDNTDTPNNQIATDEYGNPTVGRRLGTLELQRPEGGNSSVRATGAFATRLFPNTQEPVSAVTIGEDAIELEWQDVLRGITEYGFFYADYLHANSPGADFRKITPGFATSIWYFPTVLLAPPRASGGQFPILQKLGSEESFKMFGGTAELAYRVGEEVLVTVTGDTVRKEIQIPSRVNPSGLLAQVGEEFDQALRAVSTHTEEIARQMANTKRPEG